MNVLLSIKHWQLFLVFAAVMYIASPTHADTGVHWSQINILFSALIPTLIIAWLWAITNACVKTQLTNPEKAILPLKISAVIALSSLIALNLIEYLLNIDPHSFIYLLHGLSVFYSLWFTAIKLSEASNGGSSTFFSKVRSCLAFFYFFPIGIWFIQPKVNELLVSKNA